MDLTGCGSLSIRMQLRDRGHTDSVRTPLDVKPVVGEIKMSGRLCHIHNRTGVQYREQQAKNSRVK